MRIDDPKRPRWINSLPMYVDGRGREVSPLPRPTVCLRDTPGQCRLSIMVKLGWNEFTERFTEVLPYADIPDVLADWDENPEEAMRQWFGYTVPERHWAKPKSNGWNAEGVASGGSQDYGIGPHATHSSPSGRGGKATLTLDDLDGL